MLGCICVCMYVEPSTLLWRGMEGLIGSQKSLIQLGWLVSHQAPEMNLDLSP